MSAMAPDKGVKDGIYNHKEFRRYIQRGMPQQVQYFRLKYHYDQVYSNPSLPVVVWSRFAFFGFNKCNKGFQIKGIIRPHAH